MARAEGDIVITVGGDVSPLTDAVTKAERTLGKLNTATQRADKQFRAMVGTSTEMQARIDALSGVTDRLGKSAEKSAEAFAAFDRSKAAVDRLRASYDPLFAASKRYEAAVEQLEEALRQGVITQQQYASMTAKLGQTMLTADGAAGVMAGQIGKVGGVSTRLTGQIQNASYQIGDFAVQIASGTSATRALAQQLPQLLGGFGMWGAVAGAAVAIGGALVPMFLGAAEKAKTLEERTNDLSGAVSKFMTSVQASRVTMAELTAQYGRFADEMQRILAALANADQRVALTEVKASIDAIAASLLQTVTAREALVEGTSTRQLVDDFGLLRSEARAIESALNSLETATGLEAQVQAALRLMNALDWARDAAGNLPQPLEEAYAAAVQIAQKAVEINTKISQMEGFLDAAAGAAAGAASAVDGIGTAARGAYGDVAALVGKMWEMGQARIAANDKLGQMAVEFSPGGQNQLKWGGRGAPTSEQQSLADKYNPDGSLKDTKKGGGGGGGGGKGEDYAAKLEQFNQSLMTEAELELAQYQTRQEQLQTFLDQKLLTQEEYNAKLEQIQQQHSDRMAAIDVYRYGDGLQKAGAFLGDMASALQGGNEKMQKIAAKFAAVETLINAWRAYSQTLADPTLPFVAKLAAAAKVLAAGFGAVNAIKGASGGSSGAAAGGTSAAAAAPAATPANVNVTWVGEVTRAGMETLTEKLNREYKQGYRLNFAMGGA